MTRPTTNEAAEYYFRYINLIQSDDIISTFKSQLEETKSFLSGISDEKSLERYALTSGRLTGNQSCERR